MQHRIVSGDEDPAETGDHKYVAKTTHMVV